MTDFNAAYEAMIRNEGGYKLHTTEGDRGGMTYAGIARNFWPRWEGWALIDSGQTDDPNLTALVRGFYRENFWVKVSGDQNKHSGIIFDFAVNTGVKKAVKIAQVCCDATPDGVMGPKTLAAINNISPEEFDLRYTLAKVARYNAICNRDRSQTKFLHGWINRALSWIG